MLADGKFSYIWMGLEEITDCRYGWISLWIIIMIIMIMGIL